MIMIETYLDIYCTNPVDPHARLGKTGDSERSEVSGERRQVRATVIECYREERSRSLYIHVDSG
jgi:hypothetical protein